MAEERKSAAEELAIALKLAVSQPKLSLMMFLQYAIWGAWAVALAGYLEKHLHFVGLGLALIYAAFPLANLVSPFTGGQVADRVLPTQIAVAICQLLGGAVLLVMSLQTSVWPMFVLMLLYCLLFAPTLALTNSLAFRHLGDPQRDFGPIRVWGTIGWIVANLILTFVRVHFHTEGGKYIDAFVIAGMVSLAMGVFSFFLPHTPPATEGQDPLAFREALVLLRDRNYLTFFIIAFVVATELQLYYILTNPYLQKIGPVVNITSETAPAWQTIAQIAEIFTMALLLPYVLPRWGVRKSMLLGIMAWPIRYVIFALAWPTHVALPWMVWVVIVSLTLHGFCYVFFFTIAFIYTDMVAPKDIRASSQSLINIAILGVGSLLGTFFAGWLRDVFTTGTGDAAVTNYTAVFGVPAVVTFLCGIAFWFLFREPGQPAAAEPAPAS